MPSPAIQRITSNDAAKLSIGQAQYSALMTPNGAFVDDLLVYRLAADHFLLVVNASNIEKDFAWIRERIKASWRCRCRRQQRTLRAHCRAGSRGTADRAAAHGRGPRGRSSTTGSRTAKSPSVRGTISRTGYTGEDGYELFVPPGSAPRVWDALLDGGPAVRLEAGGPRRTRYAAARGSDAALWQRHRRHHDGARSRSGLDRVLDEGRLHRPRRARGTEGRRARRAASSGSR